MFLFWGFFFSEESFPCTAVESMSLWEEVGLEFLTWLASKEQSS